MNIETSKIDINNKEFQNALELIKQTNQSFFLTGKAGTGKSTFLKYILGEIDKNFVVLAPTGIAAVNVNGTTIHSFFQFPLRPLLPKDGDIQIFSKNSEKRKLISNMDTLIIDEISMVRADIIDGIDYSLRINGGNPSLPFGGKQVVFVGDIFQLEPVVIKSSSEFEIIKEFYKSLYFYNANVFDNFSFVSIELQKVYRQKNVDFIKLLDKIRINSLEPEDLARFNERVFSDFQLRNQEFTITLTTTNRLAEKVNNVKLSELNTPNKSYLAEISGQFESKLYPTELNLTLKEGAQVIFIKNDVENRWVNGTIGKVLELSMDEIKVKLENGNIHIVEKRTWENIKYIYNKEKKKIEQETVGTFEQYPLKLAWAITIHKSQGLTFESVVIDFGNGTFASGQAYVALSRATSLKGLYLRRNLQSSDIYVNNEIINFAESFNNNKSISKSVEYGKTIYKYIKRNNLEVIGNINFTYAIEYLIKGEFKNAVDFLHKGFNYISSGEELNKIIKKNEAEIKKSFENNIINCTSKDYNFLKSVYFLYSGNFEKALFFVNAFMEENEDSEIGNYLKGVTLYNSGEGHEALIFLYNALEQNNSARTNLFIGKVKERFLEESGILYIYKSILINPSSLDAHNWLKTIADEREIRIETNSNKLLAHVFNTKNVEEYQSLVNTLLTNEYVELTNGTKLNSFSAINSFIETLDHDKHLFDIITENEVDYYEDHEFQDFDDDGLDYSKYGGAYGYDDNTIDSAFEGDPDNYWNID